MEIARFTLNVIKRNNTILCILASNRKHDVSSQGCLHAAPWKPSHCE